MQQKPDGEGGREGVGSSRPPSPSGFRHFFLDPDVASAFTVPSVMKPTLMKTDVERFFRVQEFAARTGVTVRTLHHYDKLGLLRPQRHGTAGYRRYSERDVVRLQQIVTLKFIGLSLREIKALLTSESFDLAAALQMQRQVLVAKREQLDSAVYAIKKAEAVLQDNDLTKWEAFAKIIEVINMQENMDWMQKYYSDEARQKIEARKTLWTPELQEQVTRDWNQLFQEIETAAANHEDPASEKSQGFLCRWKELLHGFTGGDAEIQDGLNRFYADQANWPQPTTFQRPWSETVDAFMSQVRAAQPQAA